MSFFEPPISQISAGVAVLIGIGSAARGARHLARGLRNGGSLEVVRGIRGFVITLAAAAFAVGVLSAETGFLVFGAIVLGEELYETGILAALIRFGRALLIEINHWRAGRGTRDSGPDDGRPPVTSPRGPLRQNARTHPLYASSHRERRGRCRATRPGGF